MDHVHDHMQSEEIGPYDLRRDDHFTILFFWEEFVRVYRFGTGISLPEMEFLYTEHVRAPGAALSFAAHEVEGVVPPEEGTGELQVHDKRREDRELRRRGRGASGRGGPVDRGEPSSGRGGEGA